jgi:hypothetical protein
MKGSTTSSGKHRNNDRPPAQGLFRDQNYSQHSADNAKWGHDMYEKRIQEEQEQEKSFANKKSSGENKSSSQHS